MTTLRVVRYARPKQNEIFNDNLYGITFVYDIDYDTRTVDVCWSVCNGDNFEKKVGVEQALKRQKLKFPLEAVKGTGLTKACLIHLFGEEIGGMMVGNYPLLHHIMYDTTRYLNKVKKLDG